MPRAIAAALTTGGVVWLAALLVSPLAVASPPRDSGSVAALAVYAAGGRICHQQPARSFTVGGTAMPVCARCFGLYAAGALGALAGWFPVRRRLATGVDRWWLAGAAVPTALTWGLEFLGAAEFTNLTRALAALPLGVAAGWLFVRRLREEAHPAPFA